MRLLLSVLVMITAARKDNGTKLMDQRFLYHLATRSLFAVLQPYNSYSGLLLTVPRLWRVVNRTYVTSLLTFAAGHCERPHR